MIPIVNSGPGWPIRSIRGLGMGLARVPNVRGRLLGLPVGWPLVAAGCVWTKPTARSPTSARQRAGPLAHLLVGR
jgi:hypothetical protein